MQRGQVIQKLVDNALDAALYRNGVSYDHEMRAELNAGAVLSLDGKSVQVPGDSGRLIPVDHRIAQLKPRFGFQAPDPLDQPPPPKRIARSETAKVNEALEDIASGKVVVFDDRKT
jgi:hypothetical protein